MNIDNCAFVRMSLMQFFSKMPKILSDRSHHVKLLTLFAWGQFEDVLKLWIDQC